MTDETHEEHETVEAGASASPEALGYRLREARERRGLSLQDVASQLRLDVRLVEALESGDEERLPPAPFVSGYLRNYARLLDLPAEDLVGQYAESGLGETPPLVSTIGEGQQVRSSDLRVRVVTYLIVLALVALAGAWWWTQRQGIDLTLEDAEPPAVVGEGGSLDLPVPAGRPPEEAAPAKEGAEPAQAPAEEPEGEQGQSVAEFLKERAAERERAEAARAPEPETVEPEEATAPEETAEEAETAPAEPAPAPAGPAPEPAETAPESAAGPQAAVEPETGAAAQPDEGEVKLALEFEKECWTEVTDATGRELIYALVPAGSQRTVWGEPPFDIFLGYAPGVTVRYRDEVFDHTPFQRKDIARFQVGSAEDAEPQAGTE